MKKKPVFNPNCEKKKIQKFKGMLVYCLTIDCALVVILPFLIITHFTILTLLPGYRYNK